MNSASWWAKKLGNEQTRAPYTPAPIVPPSRSPYTQQPPAYHTPKSPDIEVTGENIMDAATQWQGSAATRNETQNCPNCGSNLYFSRTNGGGIYTESGNQATPAPRCYSCGYTQGRSLQGVPPS